MSAPGPSTMGGALSDERLALALLTRLGEPGDPALVAAIDRDGAVDVVARLRAGASPLAHAADLLARLGPDPGGQARADLERIAELSGNFVVPGDPQWPAQLADLGARRPVGLWVAGGADLRWAALRSVAVVGARAASTYGERVAAELATALAERGWCVVSGGAYGIDAAAHRGTLAVDGVTVAVMAGGVDVSYPRAHDALLSRCLHAGAVVSEVPPGSTPLRWRFLVRNRIIAALTRGTVVVEAAARSGALATAREAAVLGRVVMGVPGPVTSAMSQGVHALLQGEAHLVTGAADVIELVGAIGADLAPRPTGPDRPRDSLAPEQARVLDALPGRGHASTDAVSRTAGLHVATVIIALAALELDGWVERAPQGWRRITPVSGGSRGAGAGAAGGGAVRGDGSGADA